ncbi:MAG TPA: hypothetical protein VIK71_07575 [Flavobacteriales bacterium]
MANHDPNHSSKQRTILWIIAPVAVVLSLFLTKLNHNVPPLREELDGRVDVVKSAPAPKVEAPAATEAANTQPTAEPAAH